MLNIIHEGIVVTGKLCTMSGNTKDVEDCLGKAESPTTCIAISIDKKAEGLKTSHALAVYDFRKVLTETGKRTYIWYFDAYNQQSQKEVTYLCDPREWTSSSESSVCRSQGNSKNYFKDVFRYKISLPMSKPAKTEIDGNASRFVEMDPGPEDIE